MVRLIKRIGWGCFLALVCTTPVRAQAPGAVPPAPAAPDEFRVTLLGTGSPAPVMRRFGPAVWGRPAGAPC